MKRLRLLAVLPLLGALSIALGAAGGCATARTGSPRPAPVAKGVTVDDQSEGTVTTGDGTVRKILKKVAPDYPAELRARHLAGTVIVRFWIRPDGTVDRAEARSSPDPALSQLAVAAMAQWLFSPVASGGDQHLMLMENPILFELQDSRH